MRRSFYEKVKKYGTVDTRKYRYVLEDLETWRVYH